MHTVVAVGTIDVMVFGLFGPRMSYEGQTIRIVIGAMDICV